MKYIRVPFCIISASKVSELWSDVSSHPSLWDRVDCSLYRSYKIFTEHYLQKLCKERFCHTRELILSGCDSQVTARTIKVLSNVFSRYLDEGIDTLTRIVLSGN